MRDSSSIATADELPPSAAGHLKPLGLPVALPEPDAFGAGSGGVLSSARDLAAWLTAQSTPSPLASPAGVAATHTPRPGASYALGWATGTTPSGARIVDHGGDLFTSTAYQALLPDSGYALAVTANTGTPYADAQTLAAHLIALVEGTPLPEVTTPATTVDLVILALTALMVALTILAVRRARDRKERNPLRLLPYALPPLLLATLPHVVGFLYRGRHVTWAQSAYLYPAFTLSLMVASACCAVVVATRLAARVG